MITELNLNLPLMKSNITRTDLDVVIVYLSKDNLPLTNSKQAVALEEERLVRMVRCKEKNTGNLL